PLLVRNPSIIVVPLLMAVIGVLVGQVMSPYGGGIFAVAAGGLSSLIVLLLQMFGIGTACVIADDAWRHGRASFDHGWDEARRRGGEILMAAVGFSLLLGVAQYVGILVGPLVGYVLSAAVFYFLIWALPAAAVGGIPGGAAIQASIERVRAAPITAGVAGAVALVVYIVVGFIVPFRILEWLLPYVPYTPILGALIAALFQAIALSYIALIITKTYTDRAFGR
ncbi:MAG TPA: hypothetical protein VHT53_12965, partial [Candidatus Elarobacter sp.]|nr:hypothetical protein [Candidatus Elarobacter sp.]